MTPRFGMADDSSLCFKVKFIFKGFDNSDATEQIINILKLNRYLIFYRGENILNTLAYMLVFI